MFLRHNSHDESWRRCEYRYKDGIEVTVTPGYRGPQGARKPGDLAGHDGPATHNPDASSDGSAAPARRQRDHREESAKRAKRKVRRVVRSHGLTVLDTFTFSRAGVHDRSQAMKVWRRFLHRYRELLTHGGAYVYVGELMPGGGGWHIHMARSPFTRSKDELRQIHDLWSNELRLAGILSAAEFGGWWQSGAHKYSSARHCAAYLSKYICKELGSDLRAGQHRYEVSEGSLPISPLRTFYGDRYTALLTGSDPRFMTCHYDGWSAGLPFFWGVWEPPD